MLIPGLLIKNIMLTYGVRFLFTPLHLYSLMIHKHSILFHPAFRVWFLLKLLPHVVSEVFRTWLVPLASSLGIGINIRISVKQLCFNVYHFANNKRRLNCWCYYLERKEKQLDLRFPQFPLVSESPCWHDGQRTVSWTWLTLQPRASLDTPDFVMRGSQTLQASLCFWRHQIETQAFIWQCGGCNMSECWHTCWYDLVGGWCWFIKEYPKWRMVEF